MDLETLYKIRGDLVDQRLEAIRSFGKAEGALELCEFLIKQIEEGGESPPEGLSVSDELDTDSSD